MTDIVEHLRMACNEYGYCAGSLAGDAADEIERLRAELAQRVEPVAWMVEDADGRHFIFRAGAKPVVHANEKLTPLYTAPPQRQQEPAETISSQYIREQVAKDMQPLYAALAQKAEPVAWLVMSRDGPVFAAAWKDAAHEHINDMLMRDEIDDLDDVKSWRVVPVYTAPPQRGESVAWQQAALRLGETLATVCPDNYYKMSPTQWLNWALLQTAQPQRQQEQAEPVAFLYRTSWGKLRLAQMNPPPANAFAVYASPQRQPLSAERVCELWSEAIVNSIGGEPDVLLLVRAVERAHGIVERP